MELVIIGAGGLGREVASLLEATNAGVVDMDTGAPHTQVVGFLDDNPERHGETVAGLPILGGIDWLRDHPGTACVVAIGNPAIRRDVVARVDEIGAPVVSVISPTAMIGRHVELGRGTIVFDGVVITTDVRIGDGVLLNPRVTVSHDCTIGEYTSLGPAVSLAGNVHIGAGCDIGTRAAAIPGVTIGDDSIIGAMACVTTDIPAKVTAVGVPTRVIKQHRQVHETPAM